MNRKRVFSWVCSAALFLMAAVCLLCVIRNNNQAITSLPIQQKFTGTYSWDGDTWYPLDDSADLDTRHGDLILRGHFSYDVVEGTWLNFYQNHIGVSLYQNGKMIYIDTVSEFSLHGLPLQPSLCGSGWSNISSPGISAGDEIEIHLHNPHPPYFNHSAYRDFLNTLYNSPNTSYILESYLKPYNTPFQITGIVFIIVALMLLGVALASGLLRIPVGVSLWKYGLLSLFMGGFVILDTICISFVSELVVFNTYGRQLCIILAVYCIGLCVCDTLTGTPRKVTQVAMLVSALLDTILIILSFSGVMVIFDASIYWAVSQIILCPVLILCVILTMRGRHSSPGITLVLGLFLLSAVLLDLAEVGRSIYSHGTCTKIVFALAFIIYVVGMVRHILKDHQASIQAKVLKKELEDSRIATMLSQIQPHFIYNTLGTIEQLCKEKPEAASKLVHNFSLYLRGNFSELDNAAPIRLSQEIEHVQHYVSIELIRFPDMEVRFDLKADDFLLPALSVQPLVENAIKHGLMGLESGGTVTVSSYETARDYCVSVEDNGVGFDQATQPDGRAHIGIRNIRSRLESMCDGSLTVESAPGQGTRAVITIPKERRVNP